MCLPVFDAVSIALFSLPTACCSRISLTRPANGESLDVTRRDGNAMELEIDQHRAINGEM